MIMAAAHGIHPHDKGDGVSASGPALAAAEARKEDVCSAFTRAVPFAELFAATPHLAHCAAAFEEARVTPPLAAKMDAALLQKLLPDEPLGHVLELREILRGAVVVSGEGSVPALPLAPHRRAHHLGAARARECVAS